MSTFFQGGGWKTRKQYSTLVSARGLEYKTQKERVKYYFARLKMCFSLENEKAAEERDDVSSFAKRTSPCILFCTMLFIIHII